MKFKAVFLFIVVFTSAAVAQDTETWTRIEAEKGEVSASFPAGFMVDVESGRSGKEYSVVGFRNGVSMTMKVQRDPEPKRRIERIQINPDERAFAFDVNGVKGRKTSSSPETPYFSESVWLASSDYFYTITAKAAINSRPELVRFLYSLKANGKPIYTAKPSDFPEQTVMLKSLQSSPEVVEARRRKSDDHRAKISYETASAFRDNEAIDDETLPPNIVERPFPRIRPAFDPINSTKGMSAKLRISLLANGQVGDITVYSDQSKEYLKACVESAKKIKFVPAKKNGKNVDYTATVSYDVTITSFTDIRVIPGRIY